jgi:A/G-specific adenine glycosylase
MGTPPCPAERSIRSRAYRVGCEVSPDAGWGSAENACEGVDVHRDRQLSLAGHRLGAAWKQKMLSPSSAKSTDAGQPRQLLRSGPTRGTSRDTRPRAHVGVFPHVFHNILLYASLPMAGPRLRPVERSLARLVLSNGVVVDRPVRAQLRRKIESWGARHGRRVPWRAHVSPFRVLISELLLQRTRYSHVARVVDDVLHKYPTPQLLADAPESDLTRRLASLGLRRRIVTLRGCAKALVEKFGGEVPRDEASLRSLPGVGNYVARATLCLAFGVPAAAIDSGIGRMLRRLFGLQSTIEVGYDRELWTLIDWLSTHTGREFFCGLVDMAGELCRKTPRCQACPLREVCVFNGDDGAYAELSRGSAQ